MVGLSTRFHLRDGHRIQIKTNTILDERRTVEQLIKICSSRLIISVIKTLTAIKLYIFTFLSRRLLSPAIKTNKHSPHLGNLKNCNNNV